MDSSDYFREVANQIESGDYFDNARKWYLAKYASLVIDISYYILLLFISVAIITYSYLVIVSFYPLEKIVPVVVKVSDTSQFYSQIKRLDKRLNNPNEEPDNLINVYLLSQYIRARESYGYENNYEVLERNKQFVQSFSAPQISRNFAAALTIRNPNSPILRYRNHTVRNIDVDVNQMSIQQIDSVRKRMTEDKQRLLSYRAKATFTSEEVGEDGRKTARWQAVIDYLYSPVTYDRNKEDFNRMEFLVTNYQVAEIE